MLQTISTRTPSLCACLLRRAPRPHRNRHWRRHRSTNNATKIQSCMTRMAYDAYPVFANPRWYNHALIGGSAVVSYVPALRDEFPNMHSCRSELSIDADPIDSSFPTPPHVYICNRFGTCHSNCLSVERRDTIRDNCNCPVVDADA